MYLHIYIYILLRLCIYLFNVFNRYCLSSDFSERKQTLLDIQLDIRKTWTKSISINTNTPKSSTSTASTTSTTASASTSTKRINSDPNTPR
jgi:c-di-AMP phosphodiesterase-like protein